MVDAKDVFGFAVVVHGRGWVKDIDLSARLVAYTSYECHAMLCVKARDAGVLQRVVIDLDPGAMVSIDPFCWVYEMGEAQ